MGKSVCCIFIFFIVANFFTSGVSAELLFSPDGNIGLVSSFEDKNPGLSFIYPVVGKIYFLNTVGRSSLLLAGLDASMFINTFLEACVISTGDIEEVEFIVSHMGEVIDRRTVGPSSGNEHEFSCRFYSLVSFLGFYEIKAIGFHAGEPVCHVSVSNVFFVKIGGCNGKRPVAKAVFPAVAISGKKVEFDGSNSFDPDGVITSFSWCFGDGNISKDIVATHVYAKPGRYNVSLTVTDDEGLTDEFTGVLNVLSYGVRIQIRYGEKCSEKKLDIGLSEFIDMLHHGWGERTYRFSMENCNDTMISVYFGKTKLRGFDSFFTNFNVDVDESTDLSQSFEINLHVCFPYSALEEGSCFMSSESFFSAKLGFYYSSLMTSCQGPHAVKTWFYFGREDLLNPGVLRIKIDPCPYGIDNFFPLTYNTSLSIIDENKEMVFSKSFSLKFDPATEVTITSWPGTGRINYSFGEETAGEKTNVTFISSGGSQSELIHSFFIDPLPAFMSFNLTLLGDKSFLYESSNVYNITYVFYRGQNASSIKLELLDLPRVIRASWGVEISLAKKRGMGFLDLNMSSSVRRAAIFFKGDKNPLMVVEDFPRRLRVEGLIDAGSLSGYVKVYKFSGSITTLTILTSFDGWCIESVLKIADGFASAEFDLPSAEGDMVTVGFDTDNKEIAGLSLSVKKTGSSQRGIYLDVDAFATDDFEISWFNRGGRVEDFKCEGKVTKFLNLTISVDYLTASLNISGTWVLKQKGVFLFELNKPVEATFLNISSNTSRVFGEVSFYPNRKLSIKWEMGETGHCQIYTFGKAVGEEFNLLFLYGPRGFFSYKYGFNLSGVDFINITRTIMWDTENGLLPRIWILGDKPLPGDWDVNILWKGSWYPVPFEGLKIKYMG